MLESNFYGGELREGRKSSGMGYSTSIQRERRLGWFRWMLCHRGVLADALLLVYPTAPITTGYQDVEVYFVLGLVARVVRWRVPHPSCSCFFVVF